MDNEKFENEQEYEQEVENIQEEISVEEIISEYSEPQMEEETGAYKKASPLSC